MRLLCKKWLGGWKPYKPREGCFMKLRCVNFISQEPGKLAGFYAKVLEAPIQEVVPGRWEVPVGGVTLVFTHTC